MKNLIKSGPVYVWVVSGGDDYMIVASAEVTAEELMAAMDAEEELEKFRKLANWN